MLETLLDLPGAAEALSFFEGVCPTNRLTLQPYQQAQASLSSGAGGFGRPSAEARDANLRRKLCGDDAGGALVIALVIRPALWGKHLCGTCPIQTLFGVLGASQTSAMCMGVSEEVMANIVPESWRDRVFRAGEQGASGQPGSCGSVAGTRRGNYQLQQSPV